MSISIIIPTIGRTSLSQTLRSLVHQVHSEDEIIVVGDGQLRDVPSLCDFWKIRGVSLQYFEVWRSGSYVGTEQRDFGISKATGQWLAFLDDDDIYTRDALALMRPQLLAVMSKPHIFQMQYTNRQGKKLWDGKHFRICNIGTPMFVVPRRPDLPKWFRPNLMSCADWAWISRVMSSLYPGQTVEWHDSVICIVRPTEDAALAELPLKE